MLSLLVLFVVVFAAAASYDFPLPVDIARCFLKPTDAGELGFGIDGGKGKILDVACLHTTVPENGARSAQQRFNASEGAFACTVKSGRRICKGSIGNLVVQAAFSRQSTDEEYTQWQALTQQWLRTRCERYPGLELAEECEVAFKTFQFYCPTLDGNKADSWRINLAEWLELDDDPDAFQDPKPSAYGSVSGTESVRRGTGMAQEDVAFLAYIAEHSDEWSKDPLGVMARYYSPETIKLVQDEVKQLIAEDPDVAAMFADTTETQVLSALLGGDVPQGSAVTAAGAAAATQAELDAQRRRA